MLELKQGHCKEEIPPRRRLAREGPAGATFGRPLRRRKGLDKVVSRLGPETGETLRAVMAVRKKRTSRKSPVVGAAKVKQDWRLALPMLAEGNRKKDYGDVCAIAASSAGVMSGLGGGKAWHLLASLLAERITGWSVTPTLGCRPPGPRVAPWKSHSPPSGSPGSVAGTDYTIWRPPESAK